MAALSPTAPASPPPTAWAGMVLPGLQHLLRLDLVNGLGLLAQTTLFLWAAAVGFPRVYGIMTANAPWVDRIHPVIAVVTWAALGVGLWWNAWGTVRPPPPRRSETTGQVFLRTFQENRTGMIGWYGVLFLFLLTALTPMLAPHDPNIIDIGPKNAPPGAEFWFGTDLFGRDLFSRVLYGGRISLSIGFVAVGIAASLGTALGAAAGYFGGWIDRGLMFVVDLLLSLPRLVLLLAISGMFRLPGAQGIFLIVVILGLTGWMGVSRIVRSEVLSLRQRDFVQAARALGMSDARILFNHIVPNAMAPVIVNVSLAIGATMLAEAGLSFLGLGVPPPTSTWGSLVSDGRENLANAWWVATLPGFAIVIAVMSFNMLGDGLRDALDPRLRGR